MNWRWTSVVLILGTMLTTAGCGRSDRSPLGKVTGMVTYKGEPVETATIVFHNPQGRSAIGQIIDGMIENVTTYDTLNDGAAIGTLAVTIHPVGARETLMHKPIEPPKPPAKPPFPRRYDDPETSGLTAEIQAGNNDLFFELTD